MIRSCSAICRTKCRSGVSRILTAPAASLAAQLAKLRMRFGVKAGPGLIALDGLGLWRGSDRLGEWAADSTHPYRGYRPGCRGGGAVLSPTAAQCTGAARCALRVCWWRGSPGRLQAPLRPVDYSSGWWRNWPCPMYTRKSGSICGAVRALCAGRLSPMSWQPGRGGSMTTCSRMPCCPHINAASLADRGRGRAA